MQPVIKLFETDRGAMCTVKGCDRPKRYTRARYDAVIWCPHCGEARCEKHRDVPTKLPCCGQYVPAPRPPRES